MFRKVEIWVLYLIILFFLAVTVLVAALARQELVGEKKFGKFSKTALFIAEIPHNFYNALTLNQDLIVEDRFPDKAGFIGKPNNQELYLLLSRYDGDLAESIVELVDLRTFETIHTWNPDYKEIIEKTLETGSIEFAEFTSVRNESRMRIIHPILFEDGSLLVQDASPLNRIDFCSNLIWQNAHDNFHHSIEKDEEGNIWVSSWMYPYGFDSKYVGTDNLVLLDEGITKLSPDGEVLYQKSVSEIFIENDMRYLLFSIYVDRYSDDPIHMNDIQPVMKDGPYWKKGDVFLSFRHQSMVMLYRPSTNQVIWKGVGKFYNQHDVDILNDHQIAIFNNNSVNSFDGIVVYGTNEVLIYDFETNEYSSYLRDSMTKNDIRSITEGRSEILDNGDLYIEETNYGRTLYFNNDGSLRWEHINRAENGNIYPVGWSRILYTPRDLDIVRAVINKKGGSETCSEK